MTDMSDTVLWFQARLDEHKLSGVLLPGVPTTCLCGISTTPEDFTLHVAGALVSAGATVQAPLEWVEGADEVRALLDRLGPGDEVAVESVYPDQFGCVYSARGPWDAIKLDGQPITLFFGLFRAALIRQALWDRTSTYAIADENNRLWIRRTADLDALWINLTSDDPERAPRTTSEMIQAGGLYTIVATRA